MTTAPDSTRRQFVHLAVAAPVAAAIPFGALAMTEPKTTLHELIDRSDERYAAFCRQTEVTDRHLRAGTITDEIWADQNTICKEWTDAVLLICAYRPRNAEEQRTKAFFLLDYSKDTCLEEVEVETLLRSMT